ncbi:MAG: hypothetical protein JSR80_01485 [Verrucomicrobia bacterium]|nr:hypothetical protein [Verrucomicrobiota bacterium]
MNRLVKKSLHDLVTGEVQEESYRLDKMSRQVALITSLATTTLKRDPHGRVLEETQGPIRTPNGWQVPVIVREYDGLDRVIKEVNPEGGVTEISYTDRSDWCFKKHPDGTCEKRYFTVDGQLEEEIHRDGTATRYTRDYKGRALSQKRLNTLSQVATEETLVYDGDLLLKATDARGFTTHYFYNPAGQLLQMRKEDQLTEYSYDGSGRKIAEHSWADDAHYLLKRLEYDLLDRVIAEQLEDETGKVYQRTETTMI